MSRYGFDIRLMTLIDEYMRECLMCARIDEIALSITLENGKPLKQSRLEVIRGCDQKKLEQAVLFPIEAACSARRPRYARTGLMA